MYATVDIDKQTDKTTIVIRPRKSFIFKIGLAVLTIFILTGLGFVIGIIIAGQIHKPLEIAVALGVSLILFIFVYKHLRAAFRKEILTIEKNKLTYNNSFLGLGKYFETNLNKLKKFKYIGVSQQTKHPLDIKGDVLGFGTQEGEINYLNQEGAMLLATEFDVIKFGVDVDEDDFLKIKRLID